MGKLGNAGVASGTRLKVFSRYLPAHFDGPAVTSSLTLSHLKTDPGTSWMGH